MGNTLISYFTRSSPGTDVHLVEDEVTTPISEEVVEVERPTDKQCVAWEIDVSNWKSHGSKGTKAKKRRDGRSTYLRENLREKDNNTSVGGAIETSEETKTKLVKVVLPKVKAEVKMAQCYNDIKEKKVLDLKRWYVNKVANNVTMVTCG